MTDYVSVYDSNIPMLSEADVLVQNHPLIPAKRRNPRAALIRRVKRWFVICAEHAARVEGQPPPTPETIPFTRQNLKAAFARLTIAHLDVSEKSVANALSELNGIADLLGMPRGFSFAPLNAECKSVQDRLVTHEDRGSCIRLLRVMSAHNMPLANVADAVPLLRAQIEADWKVQKKDREFKRALYAWNKAVKLLADMPLLLIDIPKVRKIWGLHWRRDLATLQVAVDLTLSVNDPKGKNGKRGLFEGPRKRPLSAAVKRNTKEAARLAASALRDSGVDVSTLKLPRDLCRPERFMAAFEVLMERAGGMTSTVMRYALDIQRLARMPGVLDAAELVAFEEAFAVLPVRFTSDTNEAIEAGTAVDRGQKLLDTLDDPVAMDAYMSLAHNEVVGVLQSRERYTVGCAYRIARALTLEIWHTVSWRIGVSVAWRLDQFVEVDVDGEERIMVRAPKGQPGNKRTPDQFLSPEAAELYRLFIDKYRDIILRHNKCATDSPYLFPGRNGEQRHPHTMRQQMNRWIRKKTGLDFHPHAIRKINPKVILDTDPRAKELAVKSGGWADDRMLRKVYGQKQSRKTQLTINEFVVSRRLRAISTVRKPKKRTTGKKPPEAA